MYYNKVKEKILELRNLGYSYRSIEKELGCSKGTISYHCGVGQKEKGKKRKIINQKNINNKIKKKIETFSSVHKSERKYKNNVKLINKIHFKINSYNMPIKNKTYHKPTFTAQDLLDKIGDNPTCYLTGQKIDLENTRSWNLDHIIPRSKGGENTLKNANICTKQANQAKSDNSLEDFFDLCKLVLEHNGYNVEKKS